MDLISALEDHTENFNELERDDIYILGDKILPNYSKHKKPSISYNYLNIGNVPNYCFNNPQISDDDYKIYFKKIKEICSRTYDDLINANHDSLGFTLYSSPNGKLWEQFKNIVGEKNLTAEQKPAFGRIKLYDSVNEGDKAPRIFFFVGHNCTLHIFLFDLFHQIYPKKSNK